MEVWKSFVNGDCKWKLFSAKKNMYLFFTDMLFEREKNEASQCEVFSTFIFVKGWLP